MPTDPRIPPGVPVIPGTNLVPTGYEPQTGNKTPAIPSVWIPKFLAALMQRANVADACRAANVSRRAVYNRLENDMDFKEAYDAALAEACDTLEREAWRRGVEGVDEPVFYQGEEVGYVRKYSDQLLITLLKAHRPEKFDPARKIALSGRFDDDTGIDESTLGDALRAAEAAFIDSLETVSSDVVGKQGDDSGPDEGSDEIPAVPVSG